MRPLYCAGCGQKIVTVHIIIPSTGLRYHKACKPKDAPVEVVALPGDKDYH